VSDAFFRNLPALVVVFPLLAGLFVSLLGKRGRAFPMTVASTWAVFAMTLTLAGQVLAADGGAVSYTFGDWQPVAVPGVEGTVPIGIEYRIDAVNALVLLIVSGIAAVATPGAGKTVAREIPDDRHNVFYALYLLCITGLLGITITGDAFNLYVLLEISSLTTYALVAMGKESDRRALTASFHYLIMGTLGASFLLLGIGYLFMVTGTLNMADMSAVLAERGIDRTVIVAFALIVVGLGIKMALFPLHQWLPNAYTYAPSAVTTLLASTATKVGIYVGLRFFFTIFRPAGIENWAAEPIIFCACLAILFGSLRAIQQTNVKRLLAFSSVAQIGYMALGVALASPSALRGALLHLLNHAMIKGALFVAAGAVFYRVGSVRVQDLRGLCRTMPLTAATFIVAGLGLVGLPLTGGFVSKWFLVGGALEQARYGVAAIVLLGSVLAVVYVLKLVEPMVFANKGEGPDVGEAPLIVILPAWVLIAGSIYCGVSGGVHGPLIDQAVQALLGGAS
jgi:multicomponent Na+:H+ antiporter subunit D